MYANNSIFIIERKKKTYDCITKTDEPFLKKRFLSVVTL